MRARMNRRSPSGSAAAIRPPIDSSEATAEASRSGLGLLIVAAIAGAIESIFSPRASIRWVVFPRLQASIVAAASVVQGDCPIMAQISKNIGFFAIFRPVLRVFPPMGHGGEILITGGNFHSVQDDDSVGGESHRMGVKNGARFDSVRG